MKSGLFASAAVLLATPCAAAVPDVLVAGSAKVDITPPVSALPEGGTIRDPLYVRAIMIRSRSDCAVLVGMDQALMSPAVVKGAQARIEKATGCKPGAMIMSATHVHSGSSRTTDLELGEPGPKRVEDAIVSAVTQAGAHLRPSRIAYGTAQIDLNINRDLFVDNRWVQGANPTGVSDKTLAVFEVLGADDIPIGVYMNYAMHPTDFYLSGVISADFPGEASGYVERAYGPGTVAIFAQGASGDQNIKLGRPLQKLIRTRSAAPSADDMRVTALAPWRVPPERNSNLRMVAAQAVPVPADRVAAYKAAIDGASHMASAMGIMIGETTINTMRYGMAGLEADALIRSASETFSCPGRDRLDRDNPVREGEAPPYADGAPVVMTLSVLRIGNSYFAAIDGEVYSEIALRLKREAPVHNLMMTTLANGRANSGYIYSNAAGSHLTFQVIGSRLKPGCAEDAVVSAGLRLIDQINQ